MDAHTVQDYVNQDLEENSAKLVSEYVKARARQLEEDLAILPEVDREAYKVLLEELRKK